jgi:hypothetical protein
MTHRQDRFPPPDSRHGRSGERRNLPPGRCVLGEIAFPGTARKGQLSGGRSDEPFLISRISRPPH